MCRAVDMCEGRARLAILCQTVVGTRQPVLQMVARRSLTLREPDDTSLGAIPTAMGSRTRLAYERARQSGVVLAPLLAKAGLTEADVLDRAVRIQVRGQIAFLDLVAQALA